MIALVSHWVPPIRLDNQIARIRRWAVWQWTIFSQGWPVAVGSTAADPELFAMCAIGVHA